MKRIRRSSSRRVKLVSLTLSYSLIVVPAVMPFSTVRAKESRPGSSGSGLMAQAGLLSFPARALGSFWALLQGSGLPSVPGPNLPNLDAARQTQANEPGAPPPIASSQPNPDVCPDCDPTNEPPISDPGGPYFGSANQAILFTGLRSQDVDPGDGISDYAWTFGDGPTIVHGATPSHIYQTQGDFIVSLTVTDHHRASTTATTHAYVNAGPTPTPTPSASPTPSPAQANHAAFVSQSVPSTMTAGQRYPVQVIMHNSGSTTWSAAHLYRLGSQSPQDNSTWGRARVYLPASVAPGADVSFNFTVLAPYSGSEEPGPATFQWRMVEDGVGYFGDVTQNQTVTIASNYQPPNGDAPQFGPFSDLFMSRIAVEHRIGQSGEDLLSGNYNWGLSLLDLPGRAGLDLNLGLSYNSLATWIKVDPPYLPLMAEKFQQSPSWTFDADRGFPSVGFRLGFPSIQGPFANVQTGSNVYLLLTTSGARVELRQVGSSNLYEAGDSSYLQLVDGGSSGLLLRTTNGSQLAYRSINGEYRCTEIKDRNGNYITIKYDALNGTANPGRVTSVIDTLGRTINFTYDTNYRLQKIEQLLSGQPPQVWATFGYEDREVQPNFTATAGSQGGGEEIEVEARPADGKTAVLGLPENNTVSVLTQVGLADGSRYNFDYTDWGQIWRTHHYAADGHELTYTSYDLPLDNSDPQTDCPRFTHRQDWAENFNNNSPVTTTFEIAANGAGQWGKVIGPDGTAYKEFFTTDYTAWQRGLVTRTETYSPDSTTAKKTTTTEWTQDDIHVPYPLNPRATATTISDSEGKPATHHDRVRLFWFAFGCV